MAGCASSEGVAVDDAPAPDATIIGAVDADLGGETDATSGSADHDAAVDGGGGTGPGLCCASGDCLCHGPDPTELTASNGSFATDRFTISAGTVHYPTNAEPPFAAVAICGGYFNTGPEMAPWASFYASHGIVTVIVSTGAADQPAARAAKMLAAIAELEAENADTTSPLFGNLSGRYGTSGYSLGGGATTLASASDPTLRTSVGLSVHPGDDHLFMLGDADRLALDLLTFITATGDRVPAPRQAAAIALAVTFAGDELVIRGPAALEVVEQALGFVARTGGRAAVQLVAPSSDPDATRALACARGAVVHAAPGEVLVTGELRGTSWGHGYVHEDRGIHAAVDGAQAVRLFAIRRAP